MEWAEGRPLGGGGAGGGGGGGESCCLERLVECDGHQVCSREPSSPKLNASKWE